jgi:hypothetical protein
MTRSGLITYEGLPKSRGGMHMLRTKSATASWRKIRGFLDRCFVPADPLTARLDVQRLHASPDVDSLVDRFLAAFGAPIRGQDASTMYLNWFLEDVQLDEALSTIDALPEAPVDTFGRQRVYVTVKAGQLKLMDARGKVLPHQSSDHYLGVEGAPDRLLGENYLHAELGKNNFLYAFFSLPFEQPKDDFREYAEYLRAEFPCPMSKSTWKAWMLNKAGTGYVGRKLRLD